MPTNDVTRLATALSERYAIEREIGRGGMATVYLARDLRHDRQVALKLLDPELGAILGVERFLAEIRVTANLQHPNLLPLFDSGEADGLLFYVMPFVEGATLRQRLERERQLPVDEAVRIATAVCGALDYAHKRGVIHRDLKPENILLNDDGQPLLADFGIALAVSRAGGARITQTGLSLGTPQYMSPEQATSDRAIDGRTDIYSLGAVTYEMLAGEPPHTAATAQGVLAKLMVEEPRPLSVLRPSVPAQIDGAIRHALAKLPADRFATAKEFADALNGKGYDAAAFAAPGASRWRTAAVALLAVALICTGIAAVATVKLSRVAPPQSVHFKIDLPAGQQFVVNNGAPLAISPDGRTIAYLAAGSPTPVAYARRIDDLHATSLVTGNILADLKFLPSGREVSLVLADAGVHTIPVSGGPATLVARAYSLVGTTWGTDGQFVYADSGAIWSVDAPGSPRRRVTGVAPNAHLDNVALPFVFPDSRDVMFWMLDSAGPRPHLAIASMTGSPITTFAAPFGNPLGYRDGWLIYGRQDGIIAAQRFDQRARKFSGGAVVLLDSVAWQDQGGLEAALSASGSLAYVRGEGTSTLVIIDAHGAAEAAPVSGLYGNAAWSPDGKKIAVDRSDAVTGGTSIWVYDVGSRVLSRVTGPHTNANRPAWTADGKRVAYALGGTTDSAVWSAPADLSGPEEVLYAARGISFRALTFSPDGKFALLRTDMSLRATRGDIYMLPLHPATPNERTAVPVVQTVAQEEMPSVSPDSRWLAYSSDETGREEIYVRPFPGSGGRVQVSADGGSQPRWTADGAHIVYRSGRAFWSASVATLNGNPQVTRRDSLFTDVYGRADANNQGYDIARDGRIAIFRPTGNADIVVITNWWAEVQAKLKGK